MASKKFTIGTEPDGSRHVQIHARGLDVLDDPQVNRGTAFTFAERDHLGLHGLLPHGTETLEEQVARSYEQFLASETDVDKWIFLTNLHDSNEVLFYKLVGEHVHEMLPIVYTPTVGAAIEQFSHLFRRPRGVFLSIDDVDGIDRALAATGLGADDIDLIVASDAEAILGIGDWGVGGIDISIGKLAVYTVAAGIDPERVLAVGLDVGTNREELLNDPRYLGLRHSRVRGEKYDEFIDTYVATPPSGSRTRSCTGRTSRVRRRAASSARYGDTLCTFDDDIQGTAAVGLACVLSGVRVSGGRLVDQQIVVFGAGSAGVGIADLIALAMTEDGLERAGGGRPDLPARPAGPADQRHDRPVRLPEAVRQGPGRGRRLAHRRRHARTPAGRREPAPDDARRHLRRHRGVHRRGHPDHARELPAPDHPADVEPDGAGRADAGEPARLDRRRGPGRDRQPVRTGRASTARRTGSGRPTTR